MLYESDLNRLIESWTSRPGFTEASQEYKDAVNDCIYDLRELVNCRFQEEALANEAFMQMLEEDSKIWNDYIKIDDGRN